MNSIAVLYDRLVTIGETCHEARSLCEDAVRQVHIKGWFKVQAPGGWIFGHLTKHGVRLGGNPYLEMS